MDHLARFFTPGGERYELFGDTVTGQIRHHHDGKIDELCTGPLGPVMAAFTRGLRESYFPIEQQVNCTEVEQEEIAKIEALEASAPITYTGESLPLPDRDHMEITPSYRKRWGRNWRRQG